MGNIRFYFYLLDMNTDLRLDMKKRAAGTILKVVRDVTLLRFWLF